MMTQKRKAKKQQGAALVISLIMLLVMTLIGISGMQTTVLEEKMAGNYKNRNTSLQAAESALRAAEDSLSAMTTFDFNNVVGLYPPDNPAQWDQVDWTDTANDVIAYGGTLSTISTPPTYIIEKLVEPSPAAFGGGLCLGGSCSGTGATVDLFKITTRAVDGSGTAPVMLQSFYQK